MTPEQIARYEAFPRPGTPGPWVVGQEEDQVLSPDRSLLTEIYGSSDYRTDATFIAAAPEMREAIDVLLAEVARLKQVEQVVFGWSDHDSWRCYSTRYPGECCCGLDDAMKAAGLGDYLKTEAR